MHNLHHQLTRLNCCKHVHAHGFLLYCVCKTLGNFEINVCIEQGSTYIFQRLCNVNLGDLTFTFQYFE